MRSANIEALGPNGFLMLEPDGTTLNQRDARLKRK
jgi:hypothetical protein